MPVDTLYQDDIVTWAEQQGRAIRDLARTRPELSNVIDWENVAEEIETLGRSELKGVASHLRNALAHILKEACDPGALSRMAWRGETQTSLREVREDFLPSMRQHLDFSLIWKKAFGHAADSLRLYGVNIPPGVPERPPFGLDDVLASEFNHERGVAILTEAMAADHDTTRGTRP
jgi:hypothetical protein